MLSSGRKQAVDHTHTKETMPWSTELLHLSDSGSLSAADYEITGIPVDTQMIRIVYRDFSLSGTDEIGIQLGSSSAYITAGYTGYVVENITQLSWPATAAQLHISSLAAYSHSGVITLTKMENNIWHIHSNELLIGAGTYPTQSMGYVDVADYLYKIKFLPSGANTIDAGYVTTYCFY